ncbi:hypothetical protein BLA29_015281, partial [Euroglyphus maynei]
MKKRPNMIHKKIIPLVLVVNLVCKKIVWINRLLVGNIMKKRPNMIHRKIIPLDLVASLAYRKIA